jgi:site-specific DNA-cytosine methylase
MGSPPDEPSRTVTGRGNNAITFRDEDGRLMYVRGMGRAASEPGRLDLPSPTVVTVEEKGTRACESTGFDFNGGPDRASDAAFLAVGRRRLEPEECAILQDFPVDWPFVGNKGSVYAQVGNACPDRLVAAVVKEVVRADRRGA